MDLSLFACALPHFAADDKGDPLFIEHVERLSMSDCESMPAEVRDRLRSIPAVHELLAEWPVMKAAGDAGDMIVREAIDAELDAEREAIRSGVPARNKRELALTIEQRCHRLSLPTLRPAVNASGVVIHTNLGRAPLAPAAVQAVADVARGYSTLEYDVATCARGGRKEHAARLLRTLTGAQDALVVNNNAAAVLLVLAARASGKEVIVSRGELVEVGGSFRIPDIMAASGAKLVEVGSTNRTHLDDYRSAITPNTAMILKVHPSNYRIEGFHEEVSAAELSALAHEHGLLLYEDQGSGALLTDEVLVDAGEKPTSASLCAGVDVVSCSGDKLLGASQAGIILGSAQVIAACASHPLMRALRPGKLTLAALEATLRLYVTGSDTAHREIPVLNMLSGAPAPLERQAKRLHDRMLRKLRESQCEEAVELQVVEGVSAPGGGSLPTVELPTFCVAVCPVDGCLSADGLKRAMVQEPDTPVVTRVRHDQVLFDVRTLLRDTDLDLCASALADAVRAGLRR